MYDVATFLAFRTEPGFRKKYERELVELYYAKLSEAAKKRNPEWNYTWEQCWEDYVYDGAARLVFYSCALPVFVPGRFSVEEMFARLLAFINDHNITPENMRPLPY